MTQLPPRKALAAARFWALKKAPYFAQALLGAPVQEVANGSLSLKGTMAMTAGGVLLYEPAALERWTAQEAGSVLIHEILHWLRDHCGRAKAIHAEPKAWNLAADAEINDDLHGMRLPLPDGGGVVPRSLGQPDGLTAEVYYAAACEQLREQKRGGTELKPGFGGEACGSAAGNPTGHPDDTDAAESSSEGQGDGEGQGQGQGSGSRAGTRGRSAAEAEAIRQLTAVAITSHAQSHGIGSVPLGMHRWAEDRTKPPKVPWHVKLAMAGRAAAAFREGAVDMTYDRISRRQAGLGFGPGRPVEAEWIATTPEVVIAVDTSGSMGHGELERAITESTAVMRAIGSHVHFVACDAAIHSVARVRNAAELKTHMKGGGGTDFRPVFHQIAKLRPKPDVLIFITDGGGAAPIKAPRGFRTLWVLVGRHKMVPLSGNSGKHIDWGTVIEVDE